MYGRIVDALLKVEEHIQDNKTIAPDMTDDFNSVTDEMLMTLAVALCNRISLRLRLESLRSVALGYKTKFNITLKQFDIQDARLANSPFKFDLDAVYAKYMPLFDKESELNFALVPR